MELREYQKRIAAESTRLLSLYKIAYLCMEVRTGKTMTALQSAALYGAKNVLFITKLKAISSIESDYSLMQLPFKIKVINYESCHKYPDDYDLIIIDEAHSLAQYPIPANRTKEIKKICQGLPIIFLSGTPTPESYAQYFHQFYVSSFTPFVGINFYKWHSIYGIPKKKYVYNRELADYSLVKVDEVRQVIDKYFINYSQQDAGFEQMVKEVIITLPMPSSIKWAIDKLRKDKIFTTKDGLDILGDTAVKEMQKIHQICSGTVKGECGGSVVFDKSKAEYIRDNFSGKKIAIFYKYVAELDAIKSVFGDMLTSDPMHFNATGSDVVFCSQIQSGREGINISEADCLIMYNIDFSALSYWQSRARLQTKDRVKDAIVYWLMMEGGIENKIYKVVQGKKDFTLSHYKKAII